MSPGVLSPVVSSHVRCDEVEVLTATAAVSSHNSSYLSASVAGMEERKHQEEPVLAGVLDSRVGIGPS